MDLQLSGKVAVVTGASKGIGLAIVEAFGREGVRVIAGSRTTTSELEALRGTYDVTVVNVDLSQPEGPASLVQHAVDQHGTIDILVNNVGVGGPRSGFLDVDDAEWQHVFDLNLFCAVRASRAALPHLLKTGNGSIVNITSINARLPFPMVVDYSAAKAGLACLTKCLSEEFAPRGVRVNAVAPGPVRTPFWTAPGGFADAAASAAGTTAQEAVDEVVPRNMGISTGRFTEAREVADLTAFLASPRAANITGSEFAVNGGQLKTV
ncbi:MULTISPECIES: SDR family NAD(P)-dependent oxidoreductase [unclassified Streptomyces]|uniref:SDR family NAD(P)-dependent oxidoreductase n=1 Tax=unclassified Streptomyces TaxID=2593676 RepID=UPI00365FE15F